MAHPDVIGDGGPKKRAPRLSKDLWTKHQAKITDLYRTNDLDTLCRKMAEDEDFHATKRQYVFQLGKWGIKKYRTGGASNGTNRRQSQDDGDAGPHYAADPTANDRLYPAVPGLAIRLEEPPTHERRTLAGDFCSGASDDEVAFRTFLRLLELPGVDPSVQEHFLIACARAAETPEHARVIIRRIAKKMEQLDDRDDTRFHRAFYNLLLGYVHDLSNLDKEGKEKPMVVHYVREAIDILLDDEFRLRKPVPKRNRLFDIVTYMLLSYGLEFHVTHGKPKDNEPPNDELRLNVLRDFVAHQNLRVKVNSKSQRTILRDCLDWCITTLGRDIGNVPDELMDLLRMKCQPSFVVWKADTFVYCFLWYKWYEDYQANTPAPWTVNSIGELGIGFADLLVTVVWMFMHRGEECLRKNQVNGGKSPGKHPTSPNNTDSKAQAKTESNHLKPENAESKQSSSQSDHARLSPDPDLLDKACTPGGLLSLAKERAQKLKIFSEGELWANALDEFAWLNNPVDLPDGEKQFARNAFKRTRPFIERVLGVDLREEMQDPVHGAGRSRNDERDCDRGADGEVDGRVVEMMNGVTSDKGKCLTNGMGGGGEGEEGDEDEDETGVFDDEYEDEEMVFH